MKPEQKIILSCRQTGEAAARLIDWLDHNSTLLGPGHSAVREDIEALAARVGGLAAAAETVPGIGLVSTTSTGKMDMLFALLAVHAPTIVGELGQRPVEAAMIKNLLPSSDRSPSCAIHRFSAAEMPPAPRGFPIRVGLLAITDIVAIIAGASFSLPQTEATAPTGDDIRELFGDLASHLSPQALPGLSERDVQGLRDQLEARWPGHPTLTALSACRYWEQFREVAAHLTDRDRRRVLAVLWRRDRAFTSVFERLCDGLDKLGQGAEAYCATDALLGKDKASGWLTRHPRSIIDVATLRSLDQPNGPMLAIMNRYGQTVDIERAVVAGLIAEFSLHLGTSRLNDLAPADVLDFPVPPAFSHPQITAAGSAIGGDQLSLALDHFARTKAIYLFERACLRRDVTSLVVVLDPASEDDTFGSAIGDWVEACQGSNAQARERVRRGLFIAASPSTRPPGTRGDSQDDEARVQRLIRDVIGDGQDWPVSWTPNRPLSEVFWFYPAEGTAPLPPTAGQSASTLLMPVTPLASNQALRSEGNIAQLVQSLVLSSDAKVKQLQLNQSLQEVRRRLRQCVLRHHASNDPAALSLWRRSIAVVVQDRLQYMIEQGRLGLLHRVLIPSEEDLIIPMQAAEHAMAAKNSASVSADPWRDVSRLGPGQDTVGMAVTGNPDHAARMADIAVSHWFKGMRRAARSARLCRELGIEMGVFLNLVDELQIGAPRCGLTDEIARAYSQSVGATVRPVGSLPQSDGKQGSGGRHRELVRLAAYGCRIISAYLEVLGSTPGRGSPGHARSPRAALSDLVVAENTASGYGFGSGRVASGGRRSAKSAQTQWEISFVNLVEDNIASAQLLAGRGDKDRELGELVSLFATGPFEVEPWL